MLVALAAQAHPGAPRSSSRPPNGALAVAAPAGGQDQAQHCAVELAGVQGRKMLAQLLRRRL